MNIGQNALRLAEEYGFTVFPVKTATKLPLIKGWPEAATTDAGTISAWWSRWPDANIGIATGAKSGTIVLDVDVKTGGLESFEELKARIPAWPDTLTARTGSGGLHVYFQTLDGLQVRNSAGRLAPGLDIRGEGGFVVAPPSIHPNGNRYEWIQNHG
jgi:hypothetical protein